MEKRMNELIKKLNEASEAYYNGDTEIMSNFEYDALFDELMELEKRTGIILPDSPTQKVGAEPSGKRPKVEHEYPSRSLSKTKELKELISWLGEKKGVLSWKMDGLTTVLTYENGILQRAVTRGTGFIGEDVTDVAPYIDGIPEKIDFCGKLVLRGEVVMSYEEFERINSVLPDDIPKYKNPRNLASGSLRALDPAVYATRRMYFCAFQLVAAEKISISSFAERLNFLCKNGFKPVEWYDVDKNTICERIQFFEDRINVYPFPTDGLVLAYDDVAYGESLGNTGHHPRHSIAFKWVDEEVETTLKEIEWSPSKTGLLNPVAIFNPVDIEGTTVQRASVHNVSIAKKLQLGIGDKIMVYKANMIIPQISKNLTKSGFVGMPDKCPVCNGSTEIKIHEDGGRSVETLYCSNPECPCKMTGKLQHFTVRTAMNIEDISEKTIEALFDAGYLKSIGDYYRLNQHAEKIKAMDGFGETSVKNMLANIEKSRKTTLSQFINALSIAFVGEHASKDIADYCDDDINKFIDVVNHPEQLLEISGIGDAVVKAISEWKKNCNWDEFEYLLSVLEFQKKEKGGSLAGLTFVITGSINHFVNRDELKAFIEKHGGKTAGSVSSKTSYLINNDTKSTSGKNKKAQELGIPVISEEQFLDMCG